QDRKNQNQGRQAGCVARLVQHALSGAARPGERAAVRLLCRRLWRRQHRRHDRRRPGAVGVMMNAERSVTTIYKICERASWHLAERTGTYRGSAVDSPAAFIPFSTATPLAGNRAKKFPGRAGLL